MVVDWSHLNVTDERRERYRRRAANRRAKPQIAAKYKRSDPYGHAAKIERGLLGWLIENAESEIAFWKELGDFDYEELKREELEWLLSQHGRQKGEGKSNG